MTVAPHRQLYLTALSILFIVLLLLFFISVSTYQNLNRERNTAIATVHRQALTLINALEAGARAGMMMQMTGKDAIGNMVREIGRSSDVNYLYLANAAGEIVYHSIPSLEGTRVTWHPKFAQKEDVHTRVRRLDSGAHVYEVAKPFVHLGIHAVGTRSSAGNLSSESPAHYHPYAIVYLGMAMTAYEVARKSDIQHAMVMGGIVLALGVGVVYFFFVIRSYYMLSRKLQENQAYTQQVIASMAHGMLSIDNNGKVVSYNQQALSLLGKQTVDLNGLKLQTVFDFHETGIVKTLDQGIPVLNREILFLRKNGDLLPLLLTVTPIQDEGESRRGAVVVIRDLSEIKRLEEEVRRAEKLAAIGRLAAGVAHEIRNPLSSIRGFAYLLGKNHGEDTNEREYADVMVREIDRINHVVTNLLNFSRPMTLELEATVLSDLIDHVVSLVSGDAQVHNIDIHVHRAANMKLFSLDPNQVTQALLNLLLNSINAIGKGGTIEISASYSETGNKAIIYVEDNGPGIEQIDQERIFEPFYTKKEHGTGLGLAMVQKIAENHDGRVEVKSPPPAKKTGARFTIYLRNMGNSNS